MGASNRNLNLLEGSGVADKMMKCQLRTRPTKGMNEEGRTQIKSNGGVSDISEYIASLILNVEKC